MRIAARLVAALLAVCLLALAHFYALMFLAAGLARGGQPSWEWPLAGLLLLSFIVSATIAVSSLARKAH